MSRHANNKSNVFLCHFSLDRKDFHLLISPYPDLIAEIEEIARERMERLILCEEKFTRMSGFIRDRLQSIEQEF